MNWFRKKMEPEFEIVTNDIPMSTVARWYLYDTSLTDDVNDLAESIGLSRVSEEVGDKEEEDSDIRMERAAPLFPFLANMAELSATVMSVIYAKTMHAEMKELSEQELEELLTSMHNIYKAIALSTLTGTFSGALELGIIDSNIVSSSTYTLGDEDEQ